jgi:hypothetical protein
MSKPRLPETTAYVRITQYSFQSGQIAGEVSAGGFTWEFQWLMLDGNLVVEPSLGRALIYDALSRFMKRSDYQLEAGGDYEFTVRAKF